MSETFFDSHSPLAYAETPQDALARAFAATVRRACPGGVLPPGPVMGLDRQCFARLLERYFPGARRALSAPLEPVDPLAERRELRTEEFDDVLNLLLEHRSDDGEHSVWLAWAIAAGCMGDNHLWQDMGLTGRQDLSELLQRHFTRLFVKNAANMKWKKFFYKQLCERAEVNMCKAPSCKVCDDYAQCFGPEEAVLAVGAGTAGGVAACRSTFVPGPLDRDSSLQATAVACLMARASN